MTFIKRKFETIVFSGLEQDLKIEELERLTSFYLGLGITEDEILSIQEEIFNSF